MGFPGCCWRCEQPGHAAAECQPPPAASKKELYRRIDRYVDRWITGRISSGQKRTWIAAEVAAFEKGKAK